VTARGLPFARAPLRALAEPNRGDAAKGASDDVARETLAVVVIFGFVGPPPCLAHSLFSPSSLSRSGLRPGRYAARKRCHSHSHHSPCHGLQRESFSLLRSSTRRLLHMHSGPIDGGWGGVPPFEGMKEAIPSPRNVFQEANPRRRQVRQKKSGSGTFVRASSRREGACERASERARSGGAPPRLGQRERSLASAPALARPSPSHGGAARGAKPVSQKHKGEKEEPLRAAANW